jgi:hypothetical protein
VHDLVQLIAAAAALAATVACKDAPSKPTIEPVRRPGVDGLVAFLEANRAYEVWDGDCIPGRERRGRLMTPGYADLGAIGPDVVPLLTAWDGTGDPNVRTIQARVLYANDPEVPSFLRRSRPAFPVGTQPMVANVDGAWMPAVWLFDDQWLCFLGIDRQVSERIYDACRHAYLNSSTGRCLDFTGALAAAVVADDTAARERLCTLMVEHGCGSVPAEAPPLSPP